MNTKRKSLMLTFFALTCMICVALSCVFVTNQSKHLNAYADGELTAEISGIQVRSAGGGSENFIVLMSDIYSNGVSGAITAANYNTRSKITIYTSEDDETGKSGSELLGVWWEYAYWGQKSLFLAYNNSSDYSIYNGTTIYAIKIEAGCELPCGDKTYVTTEDVTFINGDYGKDDNKNGAYNWQKYEPETNAAVSAVEYHNDQTNGKYILIKSDIYTESVSGEIATADYNTASKIKVYTSEDDVTGISVIGTEWVYGDGLILKLDQENEKYATLSGKNIYSIVIEAGCELPCGNKTYTTLKDVMFANKDFGADSAENDAVNFEEKKPIFKAEVTGVQVRSGGGTASFIVLQNPAYEKVAADTTVANVTEYNTKEKVTVYMAADDSTGKKLTEICGGWWTQNMWSSGGLMLAIDDYSVYNGNTIYKITIEEGCHLPCGEKLYATSKTVSYINNNYGKSTDNNSFDWKLLKNRIESDVEGVQFRGWGADSDYNFIVLRNSEYEIIPGDSIVANTGDYNTKEKVTLYMSADDTTGVKLTEVCGGWWTQNLWGSGGLMLAVNNFNTYNGKTIYGIKIEAGCELPLGDDTVLVTTDDVLYTNADYGRDVASGYATNWLDESIELKDFGEAEVTTLHNRAIQQDIGVARWLLLFFKQDFEMNKNCAFYMHKLNMLDKIKVYSSENDTEGTLLRDIYRMSATTQGLGEPKALCIDIDPSEAEDSTDENKKYKYDGPRMYAVEVMEGCQFPFMQNGEFGYATTSTTKKFYNKEYGMTGEILGGTDVDGSKRTYEAWSVVWAQKVTVTFNVVGIDGLTFESITTLGGAEVDLADYEQEGYYLLVTDSDGDEAFDVYTLPDHDVTLTLTYTKKGGQSSSGNDEVGDSCSSCSGSVSGMGLLSLLAVFSIAYTIKRKKEN